MKKLLLWTVVLMLVVSMVATFSLVGCKKEAVPAKEEEAKEEATKEEVAAVAEKVEVIFWAAPNPAQEVFWGERAEKFNASQDKINVSVTAMAETPSSEATITTALAGGVAPAASENIFPGFGATLTSSKAIVALDTLPGFDEIIENRAMKEIIEQWKVDGHVYILPVYANAMIFGWRIDILKDLGFEEPPTTYGGIMDVSEALKAKYPDKFLIARQALAQPTWWERWFDFFMLYNAASDGCPFIAGNEVTADDEAAIKVFKFYGDLKANDYLLTMEATDPFETGLSIWRDLGPWTFPDWSERFPEMIMNETFVTAPPPLPDGVELEYAKTFADAKGVVIYAQRSPEEQAAIWEFIKWVFVDPINDLAWIAATGMLTMRGDLSTNPAFDKVFEEHPELRPYADEMAYAIPAMANEKFADIQTILSDEGLAPVVLGTKTPEQGWNDAKVAIEALLQK